MARKTECIEGEKVKMNTVWLDKCFKTAEILYGVFPFGVLERPRKFDDILEIKY